MPDPIDPGAPPPREGARPYVIAGQAYAREEVIHRYLHLVKYVAGRVSVNLPPNVELNDLVNDGVVGLIDAIEKYDDGRGVKFETYAITRIHGAILDALRALDWVPRAIRQRSREMERATHALEADLGRAPSDEEIAVYLGVTTKELATLQQRVRGSTLVSLEEHLPGDRGGDIPLRDTLRDAGEEIGAPAERDEMRAALLEAIDVLPPQERTVVTQYYFSGKTLKEIKNVLGVSESRVSQVHAQAVVRLRKRLRELRGDLGYRESDAAIPRKYGRKAPAPKTEPSEQRTP